MVIRFWKVARNDHTIVEIEKPLLETKIRKKFVSEFWGRTFLKDVCGLHDLVNRDRRDRLCIGHVQLIRGVGKINNATFRRCLYICFQIDIIDQR